MKHQFNKKLPESSDDGRTIAYHLNYLMPEKISFARELRGLTKKALAQKIGVSPSAITQFESHVKPNINTFKKLVETLELPFAFFSSKIKSLSAPAIDEFHYRARASVSQMMKYKSRRYAEVVVGIYKFLEEFGIEFPTENVTPLQDSFRDGMPISHVANMVRTSWGLKKLPIKDLFPLLERNGIFIILLDQEFNDIEACATWFGDRPYIMLAYKKFENSSSRIHFDLSHELGHLFLHDESFLETEKEPQAHEFASSFLLPEETYIKDSPRKWNLGSFIDVKERWHVSIQAALRRSRDLGIISDASYRWGMIDLSKKGYRLHEPREFPLGQPTLLAKAFDLIKAEITLEEFAKSVFLHPHELEQILLMQKVPLDTIKIMKKNKEGDDTHANIVKFRKSK